MAEKHKKTVLIAKQKLNLLLKGNTRPKLHKMYVIKSSESINEETLKGELCEVGFHHMTDRDCVKQKGEEDGENEGNLYCCEES
jgi:hypothetical protein